MMRLVRNLSAAGLLCLTLAACGGDDNDGAVVTPPTPPSAKLEDGFGANFGTTYRAGNNTDPRDPAAGDVIAVSATTDPVPVP